MKGNFILFFLLLCINVGFSQTGPAIIQNIVAGGNSNDRGLGMDTTTDRGLIIAGTTSSNNNSIITRRVNNSSSDALVLRYNQAGNLLWSKCFGGSNTDVMNDIIQTMDGGFIAVGKSNSVDFDLPGGNDATFSNIWIVKLSAAGTIEWSRIYGGSAAEDAVSVVQIDDGSYIVAGSSESSTASSPFGTALGSKDLVLIKLDANGNNPVFKRLGGNRDDYPARIIQLANGNYVVVGSTTTSNNGIITGNHSSSLTADIWVVWLDSDLNHVDNRCYGSTSIETGVSVEEMSNGDLIIGGTVSYTNNGDIRQAPDHAGVEGWLARINRSAGARPGDTVWTRSYGGDNADHFRSMIKTSDGHVVIGLQVLSSNNVNTDITDKISGGNIGDVWLAKINTDNGNIIFRRSYGTTAADDIDKIMLWNSDNLLFVGTLSGTTRDGDLTGQPSYGLTDLWMASFRDVILPIHLSRFSGSSYGSYNLLEWQTASEANSKEFWIERSEDGNDFKAIGIVQAAGESQMPKQYSFKDYEMLPMATYRIRLVDNDGSSVLSRVVILRKAVKNLIVEKMYLQNNCVVFLISSNINQQATIQLLDVSGKTLVSQKVTLSKGFNTNVLQTGHLPSGMYIGVVNSDNRKYSVQVIK
jgi:hypothetical protein